MTKKTVWGPTRPVRLGVSHDRKIQDFATRLKVDFSTGMRIMIALFDAEAVHHASLSTEQLRRLASDSNDNDT
jgi:hypothetical protein